MQRGARSAFCEMHAVQRGARFFAWRIRSVWVRIQPVWIRSVWTLSVWTWHVCLDPVCPQPVCLDPGIFSGNPQASIAALQTGLGITMQKNINLIRSNEVEADTLGLKILENSNFDNTQMSKLFELMQSATGDVQKNLAYLSTHPMFEERIANTKNRSSSLSDTMTNSSMDYFFIKNILLANQEIDISGEIKSSSNSTLISRHKLALLYQKKSSFKKSQEIFYSAQSTREEIKY